MSSYIEPLSASVDSLNRSFGFARAFLKYDGKYLVQFVDIPDTFTEGHTKEEALFNAAEALSAMLAWRLDEGMDVPAASQKVQGADYVAPDAKKAAMLLRRGTGR